jgi:hypothetical protein
MKKIISWAVGPQLLLTSRTIRRLVRSSFAKTNEHDQPLNKRRINIISLILIYQKPFTFSRSHVLTFSRSHVLTFSRSHVLTFSRSHDLTFSRSHVLTMSRCHCLTVLLSYCLTVLLSHILTIPFVTTSRRSSITCTRYCPAGNVCNAKLRLAFPG